MSSRTHETDNEESTGPVTAATERLIATAGALDGETLAAPSLCPGWTRGHVITHLARNADALTNLLTWARTGKEALMYPSRDSRDREIVAGASRPLEEQIADLGASSSRFAAAVTDLPADAWTREVRTGPGGSGRTVPARRTLWMRLLEVEIHHVDLAAGYTPGHWPEFFVRRALAETVRGFGQRDDVPSFTMVIDGAAARIGSGDQVTVKGSARSVLAWLVGRSTGEDLQVSPTDALPRLPAWLP
ncbi:maleylpyruvate isomerase family mycothiol-dependent enzyme [Phytoactinopolyspora alkaliphila]|uniref:Maleylpyruvate isomerase family mycothiol-dependent enzyme n=1 Tax=Phytoactinopolyspora alkaliphila TaxID=1783498 RepID=A0A6N9YFY0_9ACTN|nr:maleylpyruvate isomerase family mycothiol-dependent enzyme [Phytoactinopolyspora alkaliphila]NED93893.1 maleylpyruvate isomerase family mycothiol-dependent enzyme [Phytoactinopolyspora alkaliphila]